MDEPNQNTTPVLPVAPPVPTDPVNSSSLDPITPTLTPPPATGPEIPVTPPISSAPSIDSVPSVSSNPSTLPVNNDLPPLKISVDNPFNHNTENGEVGVLPASPDNLVYASIIRRFFAVLLDSFVFGLMLTLISFPFIYYFKLGQLLTQTKPQDLQNIFVPYSVFFSSGLYLLFSLLSSLCIFLWGGTPGKLIFKLKIVTIEGEKVGFGQALLREMVGKWISGLVFDIGYFWALWDSKHQTWHDKIANTVVVKV